MLDFDDARSRLLATAHVLPRERVPIDAAFGRVLAETILCPADLPGFDHSAMDGYAVQTRDFEGEGPWTLPVVAESRTGGGVPTPLSKSAAQRIFTGAELPSGADAVVMQEHVERTGHHATFHTKPHAGAHVRKRGEDMACGAIALDSGIRLRPAHLALAAASDRAWLEVARRPVVTILSTGDELRLPGTSASPRGVLPESNCVALRAMAMGTGAYARVAPLVRDSARDTENAVESALRGTDVLVTVGGVSVGAHDHVRPALEKVGVNLDFWKVAMKPGKPLAVGRRRETIVLGLPGNPGSAMVTFALFGLPLLRAMQGDVAPIPSMELARLSGTVKREPGRTEFLRARAVREPRGVVATPLRNQASGAVTSMAEANALVVIARGRGAVEAGEDVHVLWMSELGA